ncbi:MAG: hypothetical protein RL557_599 [archaeon]
MPPASKKAEGGNRTHVTRTTTARSAIELQPPYCLLEEELNGIKELLFTAGLKFQKSHAELALSTMGITHCKSFACLIIHHECMKKRYLNFSF